jgi:hypothetical protein
MFRINNTNFSCTPMLNNNNQLVAYKCGGNSRTIENFQSGVVVLGKKYVCPGNRDNRELANHGIKDEIYLERDKANPVPFDVDKTDTTLGTYGKDWMYLLTGPGIPKFSYVVNYNRTGKAGWSNDDIVQVSNNPSGVDPGWLGVINVFKVGGPFVTQMSADIMANSYDAAGAYKPSDADKY